MKLGTVFPHADIGTDPAAIRDFAQAVEAAGFDYLIAYDHVTGAHPDRFAGVTIPNFAAPPYLHDSPFHEIFTLFAFLAGVTRRLELVTQRARPAAAADRPRRQAGGRGRHPERRPAATGRRAWDGTSPSTRRSARSSAAAAGGWRSSSS